MLLIIIFMLTILLFINKQILVDYFMLDVKYFKNILSDYLIATLVFINILVYKYIYIKINFSILTKVIKYFASISFSLYLFHYPLLYFYAGLLETNISVSLYKTILLIILIVLSVSILAYISEYQKNRYKKFFIFLNTKVFKHE